MTTKLIKLDLNKYIMIDILKGDESLFINPGVLEQDYLPRLLPYRENEHRYLADCIKPLFNGRNGTNLLVSGPSGIGKTACVKFIFRKLLEETEGINPIYVNCWKRDSTFKIINNIAEQLDIKLLEKKSADEIFDRILSKLGKYHGVAFAFDEFDKAQDHSFLYRFLEDVSLKTIFIISNNLDFVSSLDKRLLSRLSLEKINFKPYNFEEVRGILHERSKYAFVPNVWDYDANEIVVKKTFEANDIRFGLNLLKKSGETAENRASRKIELSDVEQALEKLKDFYGK